MQLKNIQNDNSKTFGNCAPPPGGGGWEGATPDYYPGGMLMPGRSYSSNAYRFGFNGKENDNEVKGVGNQQDYGMRIYDPRVVRFLSVDPITKEYPELTPYQFASNSLIESIDLDGLERVTYRYITNTKTDKPILKKIDIEYLDSKGKKLLFSRQATLDGIPRSFSYIYNGPKETFLDKLGKMEAGWRVGGDGANTGRVTKQDAAVALGIISTMTGAGAIVEGSAVIGGIISVVLGVDDAGSNSKGESLIEGRLPNETTKAVYTGIKSIASARNVCMTGKEMAKEGVKAFTALGTTLDAVGTVDNTEKTIKHIDTAVDVTKQ